MLRLAADVSETEPTNRRIRRARCLVGFWEDGQFVLENYLTHAQTVIAPAVAGLLQALDDYLPEPKLYECLGTVPRAPELVARLIEQDVLVIAGSWLDRKERLHDTAWDWPRSVRHFHYSAQHISYEDDLTAEAASLAALARAVPPPPPFKDLSDTVVSLPGSFSDRRGAFWEVLRARRTRRAFERRAICLRDFSTVLRWTWDRPARSWIRCSVHTSFERAHRVGRGIRLRYTPSSYASKGSSRVSTTTRYGDTLWSRLDSEHSRTWLCGCAQIRYGLGMQPQSAS